MRGVTPKGETYAQLNDICDIARFAAFGGLERINDMYNFPFGYIPILVAAESLLCLWSNKSISQFGTPGLFGWIWETGAMGRGWGTGSCR
jgi:hypothetical protein